MYGVRGRLIANYDYGFIAKMVRKVRFELTISCTQNMRISTFLLPVIKLEDRVGLEPTMLYSRLKVCAIRRYGNRSGLLRQLA
jgi:hypothetical protein